MGSYGTRAIVGLTLGPLLFLILLIVPLPAGMPPGAMKVAAVAALMATWWVTEVIPIPATALLPVALLPCLGAVGAGEVTASYANHLIYLFLGGFLIAMTLEKWNLHKRIALHTISLVGFSPNRIVLGFMVATAFLSMWISNTATAMMMYPIGLAVIGHTVDMIEREKIPGIDTRPGHFRFGISLMLGIAFAASIGGIATLVGSPPNAIFVGVVEKIYENKISFATWMAFAAPLSAMTLVAAWLLLTRVTFPSEISRLPGGRQLIRTQLSDLGPMKREEKLVLVVFVCVAAAWLVRGLVDLSFLSKVEDSTIAMIGGISLFLIPSDFKKGEFLLDWKTAVRLPWDVIILFGGGFALADAFARTGLTVWIGGRLSFLEGTNIILVILGMAVIAILLTEVTSNSATASLLLPITAGFAQAAQLHPYGLMVTVAVAVSFAFMLPVSTPPNAIVFGSRYVTIPQMVKGGVLVDLVACLLLVLLVVLLLPLVWGIDLTAFPSDF